MGFPPPQVLRLAGLLPVKVKPLALPPLVEQLLHLVRVVV
jgi:hypothetical protein